MRHPHRAATAAGTTAAPATVCGIGLNVNQGADHFAAAALPEAASLAVFTGRCHDSHERRARLLHQLNAQYEALCPATSPRWRPTGAGLGLVGKEVVAECAGGVRPGCCAT